MLATGLLVGEDTGRGREDLKGRQTMGDAWERGGRRGERSEIERSALRTGTPNDRDTVRTISPNERAGRSKF